MNPARPDSKPTTVTAAPADVGARPASPRTERVAARRKDEAPATVNAGDAGRNRRQIVAVTQVVDGSRSLEHGGGAVAEAADPCAGRREVFGQAVMDVHEVSEAFGGVTVAVLGNRVVATFPSDLAVDAVTAAVEIQRDAVRSARGTLPWSCAVSVVAGEVVEVPELERAGLQPVGAAVERALRLNRCATAGSVLLDEEAARSVTSTGPEQASSGAGTTGSPGGRAGEPDAVAALAEGGSAPWTLGDRRVLLDEGDEPISCYEVAFEAHTPARSARVTVSKSAEPRGGGRSGRSPGGPRRGRNGTGRDPGSGGATGPGPRRRPWSEGRVFCWFTDRGRGVITSTTGQEFYVDRRFLAVGSELAAGDRVFFVPRDPVARGRNPVAAAVLGEGARLEVRIEKPAEGDQLALAAVSDSNGTSQVLPVDVSSVSPVSTGDWLLVGIAAREGRPLGRPL